MLLYHRVRDPGQLFHDFFSRFACEIHYDGREGTVEDVPQRVVVIGRGTVWSKVVCRCSTMTYSLLSTQRSRRRGDACAGTGGPVFWWCVTDAARRFDAGETGAAAAFAPPAGRGGRGGGNAFADLPAFCRVAATLRPTTESDIKIEVWLPMSGWNGKFQAIGNGGWNGNIDTNGLAGGVRRGYATASTDTGHEGGGGPWMQNLEKLVDYGHRAVHEMTVAGKAMVNAFYEQPARFAYFNGCSAGGRQGLVAAQRYPDDFDGIVAGAPALNATGRAAFSMWIAQHVHESEASFIPASKFPAIHEAVLQACDARDGVTDRSIENPQACTFDPQVLACTGGDSDSCLTPAQVETARVMYQPLVNPRTKEQIFPGLSYGSELGWGTFAGKNPTEEQIAEVRKQFGQLIGSFQSLQHRAAIMFTELELTRSCRIS